MILKKICHVFDLLYVVSHLIFEHFISAVTVHFPLSDSQLIPLP